MAIQRNQITAKSETVFFLVRFPQVRDYREES
jgi:hypothetical protein